MVSPEFRKSKQWVLWCLCACLILFFGFPRSPGQEDSVAIDPELFLNQLGYPTQTVDNIMQATKSDNYAVRHLALEVLTKRIGKEAIPTLKSFLSDPKVEVRHRAAHFLATVGDKSGLEQMRKDLHELAPDKGKALPLDPNMDERTRKRIENTRNSNLVEALYVSHVLAELGDYSGYELATELVFNGKLAAERNQAVMVILETAKADDKRLKAEGKDPVSILCKIAREGTEPITFYMLINGAKKLDPNNAVLVLETAKNSPLSNQGNLKSIEWSLKQVRKAANKNSNDSNEPNRDN